MSVRGYRLYLEDWRPIIGDRAFCTVTLDIEQLGRVVIRGVWFDWDEPQQKWQVHWPTTRTNDKEYPVAALSGAFSDAVLAAASIRLDEMKTPR